MLESKIMHKTTLSHTVPKKDRMKDVGIHWHWGLTNIIESKFSLKYQ